MIPRDLAAVILVSVMSTAGLIVLGVVITLAVVDFRAWSAGRRGRRRR